jgi:hypothetical protein
MARGVGTIGSNGKVSRRSNGRTARPCQGFSALMKPVWRTRRGISPGRDNGARHCRRELIRLADIVLLEAFAYYLVYP